ncbi:MAG: hypothetical protein AAGH81_10940 [Bacteroidota bacterium]
MRKICSLISTLLSLLVLLSTTSWSVDKHLCMGRVMDVAFFHDADSCGMEDAMTEMNGKHCCDDESFTVEGQDDLKLSWDEVNVDTQKFLIAFLQSYLELLVLPLGEDVPETIYPPPLLVQDLIVLHEVFLI